jgi:RsiW-degrading membrane proteinase PrsW (M82 family)
LIIFEITPLLGVFGASAAGIVEEIGKLATVLFAMRFIHMKRYRFRLNALLFGAAVGAGFAAFESAGYALRIGLQNSDEMISNITLRGVMSPFGHIVWTAIATSAYWIARKDSADLGSTLSSGKFLTLFSVPVALHFVWNLPFEGPLLLKYWVLGLVAWIVIFSLVQTGLREIYGFAQIESCEENISPVLEDAGMDPQDGRGGLLVSRPRTKSEGTR